MPVQPLFIADMLTLKKRLRLGGVPSDSSAHEIIEKAVEDVRVGFFSGAGLGEARVLTVRAITFAENALTATSLVRTQANNLEVSWVRLLLLRRMPLLFMDAGSVVQEDWNEVPITRASRKGVEAEIKRLEEEIKEGITALVASETVTGLDIFVIEPAVAPEGIGDSIKPLLLRGQV